MGAVRRFFRLRGRSSRLPYWIVTLGALFGFIALVAAGFTLAEQTSLLAGSALDRPGSVEGVLWTLAIGIVYTAFVLPVTVRRLHDRAKSAWWLVPYLLVPTFVVDADLYRPLGLDLSAGLVTLGNVVGYGLNIAALVDLGLLRGTHGPNRYGPDPLDPDAYDPDEAQVFD